MKKLKQHGDSEYNKQNNNIQNDIVNIFQKMIIYIMIIRKQKNNINSINNKHNKSNIKINRFIINKNNYNIKQHNNMKYKSNTIYKIKMKTKNKIYGK